MSLGSSRLVLKRQRASSGSTSLPCTAAPKHAQPAATVNPCAALACGALQRHVKVAQDQHVLVHASAGQRQLGTAP